MSTSKLDDSGCFDPASDPSNPQHLCLALGAVRFRANGIEFGSRDPLPVWTEMTVQLKPSAGYEDVACTGVIVACEGNRHLGYQISMVLMNLTPKAEEQLRTLSHAGLL